MRSFVGQNVVMQRMTVFAPSTVTHKHPASANRRFVIVAADKQSVNKRDFPFQPHSGMWGGVEL